MTNTMLSLLSKAMVDQYTQAGFWRDDTIYALAAGHAQATPDAAAVRDAAGRLSYRELVDAADSLAFDMAARGVRMGQRVAVWLPSRVETAIALLACSRNGYVCCLSLHRDHTVADIVALCDRMRAVILIAQPGYGADAARADVFAESTRLPSLLHAYRLLPTDRGFSHLLDPMATPCEPNRDPNQVIYLPFTSGTTGQPKGVMHSDNTLIANARQISTDWHFGRHSVTYTLSPLSHNLGLGALIASIVVGGELVVHDTPRGASLLDRLVETGATFLFGVPTHAIDLLTELRARGATRLGQVTGFRISGAAASSAVISALMGYGVTPQSGYGMTETCSHQYTLPTDDPALITDSCGPRLPRLRGQDLASGRSECRGGDRRDRPDRRPRRQPDAGLFRRPEDHGRFVQRRRLVLDRRSGLDGRERLPAHLRPQEGPDHPRRPQYLPGEDRGAGHAPPGRRQGRRLPRGRRAAGREGLPGHRSPPRRADR